MTTSLQHSRLLSFLTQVMNKKWHLTPEPVKIVNHRWWQTSQSIWTDDFYLVCIAFSAHIHLSQHVPARFPLKVRSQSLSCLFTLPYCDHNPCPHVLLLPPFSIPFTKSFILHFMPKFDHNHSINSTHIRNSIHDLSIFIYLFILCCPVPQSCPISLPRLNATPLPCFAFHSADAKSLRDPSKIKTMRLQVGQAFDLSRLLQDIWSF